MLPPAPMLSALSHWLGSCNRATGGGWRTVVARQNESPEAYAPGTCWWLRPASIR